MQVELIDFFKSARNKVCGHSDFYVFRKNGKTFTGRKCNKRRTEYSSEEIAQHNKFRQASATASAIMNDAEQRAAAIAEWKESGKNYYSLRGYLMAKELKNN